MASSRVGSRISARIGLRLPFVLGAEVASSRSMMGIRKLSVLPVPVDAVARMSNPSSAGGIAFACTGVGTTKPALARRVFREEEMLKSLKQLDLAASEGLGLFGTDSAWSVSG